MQRMRMGSGRVGAALAVLVCACWSCGDPAGPEVAPLDGGFTDKGCGTDFDCNLGDFCIRNECVPPGVECVEEGDCAEGFECHAGYCLESMGGGCASDEECGAGEICEDEECLFGCREDADCGEGRECNTNTHQCFAPPEDCGGACPAHTLCDTRTGVCVADGTCGDDGDCQDQERCEGEVCVEGRRCARSVECPGGQRCDRALGACVEGCRQANECRIEEICVEGACTTEVPECDADALEPNQGPEQASALLPRAVHEGLTICDEEDWFHFTAFEGDEIEIVLSFVHDEGNINLQLFDPSGEPLQLVAGQMDGEQLRRTLTSTGEHTLKVFGGGRGVYNRYDLSFEVERSCVEDDSEENDGPEQAAALDPLAGPLLNRFVCGEDDDWFAIELFAGESLELQMSFEEALGALSLELHDAQGALIEAAEGVEGVARLSHAAPDAQVVLARVPGALDRINRYDLDAQVTSPDCVEDEGEQDDAPEQASEVAPGSEIEGQICAGDEDWVSVVLPADATLRVSLAHVRADGDLSLAVFGPEGVEALAEQDGPDDVEVIELLTEAPGRYGVRVRGRGRAQGAYTLTVASDLEASCPEDDRLEENDGFESPSPLEAGRAGDLIACGADEDWLSFELEEGQSAELFVLAPSELGSLDVALYGPEATSAADAPVDQVRGASVSKRVRVQIGAPGGLYRVRVNKTSGEALPWSARLNIYDGPLPLSCEFDDEFEPNNIIADAVRLGSRRTVEAIVCGQDVDWFRFDALAGEVISVRADFEHAQGDINLVLHGGMPLAPLVESRGGVDGEFIQILAERSGPLFVEVSMAEGASNTYALSVSRIEGSAPQSCVTDDVHEQNDDFASAALLPEGRVSGVHCGLDDDHFALPLGAGQTLRAHLFFEGEGLGLSLLEGPGALLSEGVGSVEGVRTLEFEAVEAVEAALAVVSEAPTDGAWAMSWRVYDGLPTRCGEEDALEPDDDPGQATLIEEDGALVGLSLCGEDEDWLRITVPSGMRLVAEARFDPLQGDLDAELYDEVGGGVSSSRSTTGLERVEMASENRERVVYLRVLLADGAPSALGYELRLTYDNVSNCLADALEDNNSQRAARTIQQGQREGLTICPDDEDWFLIDVNQLFATLNILIEFDGDAADLDLVLYEGVFGVEQARSSGLGDNEQIIEQIFFPGPYFIQVLSFDGGTTGYRMNVRIQ